MPFPNATLHVRLGDNSLPYYYEYAPFLWGVEVDYDSDGDAYNERQLNHWTILDIRHRQTNERLLIKPLVKQIGVFVVQGDEPHSVQLASYLTAFRSHGIILDPITARELPLDSIVALFNDMDERLDSANKLRASDV